MRLREIFLSLIYVFIYLFWGRVAMISCVRDGQRRGVVGSVQAKIRSEE